MNLRINKNSSAIILFLISFVIGTFLFFIRFLSLHMFFIMLISVLTIIFLLINSKKLGLIFIFLLILLVTNIFCIFNVLEEYRLPGIGKPSDFLLIFSLVYIISTNSQRKIKFIKQVKKIVKWNVFIIFYIVFLIIYSSYITGRNPFNYSLRIGAIYFYYAAFLIPIFLVNRKDQLYSYIIFLRIGALVTGFIAIISNVLGYSIVTGALSGNYGNYVRVYLPAYFNYFVIVYWIIQIIHRSKIKIKINIFEMLISMFGILLFLGRTRIIVLLLMILFVAYYLKEFGYFRKVFVVVSLAFLVLILFKLLEFDVSMFFGRFQEGYYKTLHGESTLSLRFNAIVYGYQIFSKNIFFGTGFIHPSTPYYNSLLMSSGYVTTNNYDFGLVSILYTTGLIGFSLITLFVIKVIKYVKSKLDKLHSNHNYDTTFTFSLTVITIAIFVYFVEQWAGNNFANRIVSIQMISLAFSFKYLQENNKIKNLD